MSRDHAAKLIALNRAIGGVDADDFAALGAHARNFTFLNDVHAHVRARPCIAPRHRIVARCAAACLPKATKDWISRAVEFNDRANLFYFARLDPFCRHALQSIRMGCAFVAANFVLGLRQHQNAAR